MFFFEVGKIQRKPLWKNFSEISQNERAVEDKRYRGEAIRPGGGAESARWTASSLHSQEDIQHVQG